MLNEMRYHKAVSAYHHGYKWGWIENFVDLMLGLVISSSISLGKNIRICDFIQVKASSRMKGGTC